jgi:FKBP12-rapamycin complex-associated protein
MSTLAMQQFVAGLKSRSADVRQKTARELSLYVKSELREATADEITSFLDEFNHHIFEMVSSNDPNEKKGGILAIGQSAQHPSIYFLINYFCSMLDEC